MASKISRKRRLEVALSDKRTAQEVDDAVDNSRKIVAGANVTVSDDGVNVTISSVGPDGGENNTASNVGGEKEVFKQKVAADLQFRTLKAGANITLTQNANDIEISAASGGSVADAIVDGVTTVAPSQNAVFDALALKADDSAAVHLAGTETITGYKTFQVGLKSDEEVLIDSTLNPYASIRTPNTSGISKDIVFATGDSATDNSGDTAVVAGGATMTTPNSLVMQGLTITYNPTLVGRIMNDGNVQIIIDDTNITNPTAPNFGTRGSAGQRLVIRVNSATTVNDVVAAFLTSGLTGSYTVAGSGTSTFTNDLQFFSGAKGEGRVILGSNYRVVVDSDTLMVGYGNGGANITTGFVDGALNSDSIFMITGRVRGTGNSGSISIRSADMEGSGASGSTFVRTGSVNGSLASGSTTISTGATNQFSTANSGALNLNTGNINGVSGTSGSIGLITGTNLATGTTGSTGSVFLGSGTINSPITSGTTGQAQLFAGGYAGTGAVNGGLIFVGGSNFTGAGTGSTGNVTVRSGEKTNAGASGNTGFLFMRSGGHSGIAGNSGNLLVNSGDLSGANIGGTSGSATFRSGNISNAGATGATGFVAIVSGDNSGSGNTGALDIRSGQILGAGTGSTGGASYTTGNVNNGSGMSGNVYVASGSTINGASGNVGIQSGIINGTASVTSGSVSLASGGMTSGAATASTGLVQVFSGNVSAGNGTSGNLNINSGSTTGSGNSGIIGVGSGVTNGSGNSGSAGFGSGQAFGSGNSGYTVLQSGNTNTGNSGTVDIRTGNVGAGTNSSGTIQLITGSAANNSNTGGITIRSENALGAGASGFLSISTGSSADGATGNLNLNTGFTSGSGSTGSIFMLTGNADGTGNSGQFNIGSGNAQAGNSGNAVVYSGNVISGSGQSGVAQLYSGSTASGTSGNTNIWTGASASGNSGNLFLSTGSAGGTRGVIDMNARALQVQGTEYISLNAGTAPNANIILNHSSNNGQIHVQNGGNLGSGDLGLSFKVRDESSYGHNIHSSVFMVNYQGNKTHLGILAGNDSPTAQAGNLLLAAGGAGTGANNGGNIYLESGYSLGGNGGSINLRINGPGTTVGKIGLDGVMKVSVRTGHTNLEDGDVWFDGTNLYMRIGGVTKTFTMV